MQGIEPNKTEKSRKFKSRHLITNPHITNPQ